MAGRLTTACQDGRYDDLTEPVALAERVTADLQLGNEDKHLRPHEPGRREVSEEARTALEGLRAAPTS